MKFKHWKKAERSRRSGKSTFNATGDKRSNVARAKKIKRNSSHDNPGVALIKGKSVGETPKDFLFSSYITARFDCLLKKPHVKILYSLRPSFQIILPLAKTKPNFFLRTSFSIKPAPSKRRCLENWSIAIKCFIFQERFWCDELLFINFCYII